MADTGSDIGAQAFFRQPQAEQAAAAERRSPPLGAAEQPERPRSGARAILVGEEATSRGWGRGPVGVDTRKFKYDRTRALMQPAVQFTSTKADRLDADEAGDVLHRIHEALQIDKEDESRILAFDNALWWQHTLNGASILQPGRGSLTVGGMQFDISDCLKMIGESQLRRFFRSYADEIAEVNRTVIAEYDPYNFVAAEKYGQLMQIAVTRGLHKFPEYAYDAADACLHMSIDARRAVLASKAFVIPKVNMTDRLPMAVGQSVNADDQTVQSAVRA